MVLLEDHEVIITPSECFSLYHMFYSFKLVWGVTGQKQEFKKNTTTHQNIYTCFLYLLLNCNKVGNKKLANTVKNAFLWTWEPVCATGD